MAQQDIYRSLAESYQNMYDEGYKKFPSAKVQDKAAMKPDTAKGESQARKMDTVRTATKMFPGEVKGAVKGQQLDNNKKGLEKKFVAPSADKGAKNKAYKLENQRRKDLNKRYGPKKEDVAEYLLDHGFAMTEESALAMAPHVSEEWLDQICEGNDPNMPTRSQLNKMRKKSDEEAGRRDDGRRGFMVPNPPPKRPNYRK